ncbi:hypothetical protein [Psychrosphaera haliotis]|uniref:Uncharacterized protein n=1 Tax=Psychrosphaera haliotis TaxID=555083 RepID=A0A6N8FEV2_9GAMM|nr:hypothetical protein [Psychrosphaera haliotis]MUH73202.1 hypothetical protein [Psychrosphaera haliotis]
MKIVFAFLAAILLPALLITAWYLYGQFVTFEHDDPYIWVRTRGFLAICITVSAGFVVFLGLPTYFLLRKLNSVNWWATLISGFVLGAIPMAIFTWPLRYPEMKTSASVNGVKTMIDGVPTLDGWLQFLQGVSFLGVCGMVGALAFWLAAPNKPLKQDK